MTFSMIVYVFVLREGQKCNILLTDKMTTKISLVNQVFFRNSIFYYFTHHILPLANKVSGKVMFLHLSVSHSVYGGSLYDVTSYLAAGPKFLLGVSVPV